MDLLEFMEYFSGFVIFLMAVIGICALYDGVFVKPVASNEANKYCADLGLDQYKSYSRVGLFSRKPIAIKCEYAERYTDLGVRANTVGGG